MTQRIKFITAFSTLLIVVMLTACTKQNMKTSTESHQLVESQNSSVDMVGLAAVSAYSSTPTAGNYVPNSSISITGTCGTHFGALRAYMLTATGSSFTVRISMQSGLGFGYSGTAYLK